MKKKNSLVKIHFMAPARILFFFFFKKKSVWNGIKNKTSQTMSKIILIAENNVATYDLTFPAKSSNPTRDDGNTAR